MALTRKRVSLNTGRIQGRTIDMSNYPGNRMATKSLGKTAWKPPSREQYEKQIKELEDRLKKTQEKIVDLLIDEEFEKPTK